MKVRSERIQTVLDRMHVSLLILLLLMLLPTLAAALNVQHAEQVLSLSKTSPLSPQKAPQKTPQKASQNTYGPVRRNEGLWEISDKLRSNLLISKPDITIPQIAVALFKKNQSAFKEHNINGVLVGSVLDIPDVKQILTLNKSEAYTLFFQHWEIWKKRSIRTIDTSELIVQNSIVPISEEKESKELLANSEDKTKNTVTPGSELQIEESQLLNKSVHLKKNSLIKTEEKLAIFQSKSEFIYPKQELVEKAHIEQSLINEKSPQPGKSPQPENSLQLENSPQPENSLQLENSPQPEKSFQPEQQKVTTDLINDLTQLQLKLVYKQTLQEISAAINWLQYDFKFPALNGNLLRQFANSPIAIISFGLLLLFIFLAWVFKQEETDYTEIKTTKPLKDPLLRAEGSLLLEAEGSLLSAEGSIPLEAEGSSLSAEGSINTDCKNKIATDSTQCDKAAVSAFFENNISNQFDINKFITSHKKKSKRNGKNLLEAAYERNIFSNNIAFIQEDNQLIKNTDSSETFILDSVDEIRFINEQTRNLKIDAFIEITQTEKLTDEMLFHDFDKIKNNEEIDVFIQELEDIMSNLESHTPAADSSSENMENLLQFKLSIHLIKVLSNMMQVTHLKQFSTCVIGFLEDILDGNTKMTKDISNHLLVVVNFYKHYIHLVKENYKIKA